MNVESLEPWIWTNYSKKGLFGYIVITNNLNKKKIKCFKRTIDPNFLNIYNQEGQGRNKIDTNQNRVLVINEYYRKKLEIETGREYDLSINKANYYYRLFLNLDHPNPQVQYGNRMALCSFAFGILSFILGILAIILAIYQILICK